MTREVILALDLATNCGMAAGPIGGVPVIRSQRIGRKGSSVGAFLDAFEAWLDGALAEFRPTIFAAMMPFIRMGEDGQLRTSRVTAVKLFSLAGMAEKCAHQFGIAEERICDAVDSEVVKFFCGRGHYKGDRDRKKRMVMSRCRELGWEPSDDDGADAAALFQFIEAQFFPKARSEALALVGDER